MRHHVATRMLALSLIAISLVALAVTSPLAAGFRVVDLGTLGGTSSEATALNNAGEVVGSSTDETGAVRAFLYQDGAMLNLGTMPGGSASRATAINELGQVVGFGGINQFGPQFREFTQGFLWDAGTMRSLGALYCPCSFNQRYGTSAAYGINDLGQAVGDSGTVRGESVRHAFLWQNGPMQDIGGQPGDLPVSVAYAINGAGQAVGAFDNRAALFEGGGHQDLGTLPGHTVSTARAINDAGVVVGESGVAPGAGFHAFLWDGAMHDLGTLRGDAVSQARGINDMGLVVGWSGAVGGASRAFVWLHGVMLDLNLLLHPHSGWVLTSAAAINDRGEIAGVGLHDGQPRAFLLTWENGPSKPFSQQKLLDVLKIRP